MASVLRATWAFLTHRNRLGRLGQVVREWTFLNGRHPSARYLAELYPEIGDLNVAVDLRIRHPFELPYGERLCLAALVRLLRPSLLFEFGTYTGSTTRLLADAAGPLAVVHTLDLPDERLDGGPEMARAIGREFRHDPAYRGRIVQHRTNSRDFNPALFEGRVGAVFVDASHKYEDVAHDSSLALRLVSPGGVVVWDDYQASTPGVVRALEELSRLTPLVRLAGTRLVLYGRGGDAHPSARK